MLMRIGPVAFEVAPLNSSGNTHSHSTRFAVKPVLGGAMPLEYIGEGAETWTIDAKLFPEKFGGLGVLEQLRQIRQSGRPQYMMRGDGSLMGWVAILDISERSKHLNQLGVGKVITVSIKVQRANAPSRGEYYSMANEVFGDTFSAMEVLGP